MNLSNAASASLRSLGPLLAIAGLALSVPACIEGPDGETRRVGFRTAALTADLSPTRDTSIISSATSNENGAGGRFYVGTGGPNTSGNRRALILFDVSAFANASITRAQLYATVSILPGGSYQTPTATTITLRALTQSWGEGTLSGGQAGTACGSDSAATWLRRYCTSFAWTTQGGDYSGTISASLAVGTSTGLKLWDSISNAQMLTDVQNWANGSANYGWLMRPSTEGSSGTVRGFDSREGTSPPYLRLTYTCDTGYQTTGAGCTPTSNYCGSAGTVTNATGPTVSGGVAGGSTNSYGATAAYTCNNGYSKSGSNRTCQANATWTTAPTCPAISAYCSTPTAIANDAVSSPTVSGGAAGGSTTSLGATAAYTCSPGYTKSGSDPTCTASTSVAGVWGATPSCNATSNYCGTPATVTNATGPTVSGGAAGGSTYSLNATAAYTCNTGYTKSGSDSVCQSGGAWSAAPTCTADSNYCGAAPTVTNAGAAVLSGGVAGAGTSSYGATAAYACNSGYSKSGSDPTCSAAATWGTPPTCTVISNLCGTAPVVANASAASVSGGAAGGSTSSYGATAAYACNTGYTKSGSDSTCQANGSWTTAPSCVAVSNYCGTAPVVSNAGAASVSGGVAGGSTSSYNATAAYTCNTGYVKSGSNSMCQANASWSTAPTCSPQNCGTAPVVANAGAASVSGGAGGGSTTTYGATAAYTCNSGYSKSGSDPVCSSAGSWGSSPTCNNVNECTQTPTICGAGTCSDTPGAYSCACLAGYTFNGTTCVVTNDCVANTPCDTHATCTPIGSSSHTCACNSGWSGTGEGAGSCSDVNECTNGTNNCSVAHATCTNTQGSFTCGCASGYTGNGTTACTNVNECANATRPCTAQQACTDTDGSYLCTTCGANATPTGAAGSESCACNSGYQGNPLTGCTDVNECANTTRPCTASQACVNTAGSFTCNSCGANATPIGPVGSETCACNSGWSGNGVTCTDVNECTLNTDNCNAVATCTNTQGGFSCACNSGYSGNGVTCSDVDECALNTDNCNVAHATCTNTVGAFACGCAAGYSGNGVTSCTDVNECANAARPCSPSQACVNSDGGYVCNMCGSNAHPTGSAGAESCVCDSGYQGNATTGCTDINECANAARPCPTLSACVNNAGSFACNACGANAHPVGTVGAETCSCNTGYEGNAVAGCTDIDECAADTDNCSVDGKCTNVPASFTCACKSGFSGDGVMCTDLDECTNGTDDCSADATCANSHGSFVCTCKAGYSGDGVTCDDIDECMNGTHTCDPNATCTNALASFTCKCNSGFQGPGPVCSDIDDCATSSNGGCGTNEMCVNQLGVPHTCECVPGTSRPANDPTGACSSDCGNGARVPMEQCDDGNLVDGDGCSATCDIEPGYACREATRGGTSTCMHTCGDAKIDPPGEECDDGPRNSDSEPNACRTTCRSASCGDDVLDDGEGCDDGVMNSDTRPDACRTTCRPAFCGDGTIDIVRGEICDHGYGEPLTDDYCATKKGCARRVTPPGDGGTDGGTTTHGDKGCGCRVATSGARGLPGVLFSVLFVAAVLARRRLRRVR